MRKMIMQGQGRKGRRRRGGASVPAAFAGGAFEHLPAEERLTIDIDAFEGPLDVLLALARRGKLDLLRVSLVELADQYLAFMERGRVLDMTLAAEYLVMASSLAWLKSRLLLPGEDEDECSEVEESAEALRLRLMRLAAFRKASSALARLPCLGRDFFTRSGQEGLTTLVEPVYEGALYDVLTAYSRAALRRAPPPLRFRPPPCTLEGVLLRLRALAVADDWLPLSRLARRAGGGAPPAMAMAASLGAALELAHRGVMALRQENLFSEIWLRASAPPSAGAEAAGEGGA